MYVIPYKQLSTLYNLLWNNRLYKLWNNSLYKLKVYIDMYII